jgi:hypothetical protein
MVSRMALNTTRLLSLSSAGVFPHVVRQCQDIHSIPAQESLSDGVERAYQAQFKFHCRMATEAGKLCLPLNIFV